MGRCGEAGSNTLLSVNLRAQRTQTWRTPAQGLTKVHVNALVNDTVAALAAARYLDGPDAVGSVIMGTGALLRACTALTGLLAVEAKARVCACPEVEQPPLRMVCHCKWYDAAGLQMQPCVWLTSAKCCIAPSTGGVLREHMDSASAWQCVVS